MPLYTQEVQQASVSTVSDSTVSSVKDSLTTSQVLAPVRTNRKGLNLYNDSTSILYIDFKATAATDAYAILIPPKTLYEMPFLYTGAIAGLWVEANGKARVTEFV